jgi:hypothetical protein
MKAIRQLVLVSLMLACAGCAHTRKLAGLYVPSRCIQKVSWSKPCATVSEHLVKCDGVMDCTALAGHVVHSPVSAVSLSHTWHCPSST